MEEGELVDMVVEGEKSNADEDEHKHMTKKRRLSGDEEDLEQPLSIKPPPVMNKKHKRRHKKHKTNKDDKKKKRNRKKVYDTKVESKESNSRQQSLDRRKAREIPAGLPPRFSDNRRRDHSVDGDYDRQRDQPIDHTIDAHYDRRRDHPDPHRQERTQDSRSRSKDKAKSYEHKSRDRDNYSSRDLDNATKYSEKVRSSVANYGSSHHYPTSEAHLPSSQYSRSRAREDEPRTRVKPVQRPPLIRRVEDVPDHRTKNRNNSKKHSRAVSSSVSVTSVVSKINHSRKSDSTLTASRKRKISEELAASMEPEKATSTDKKKSNKPHSKGASPIVITTKSSKENLATPAVPTNAESTANSDDSSVSNASESESEGESENKEQQHDKPSNKQQEVQKVVVEEVSDVDDDEEDDDDESSSSNDDDDDDEVDSDDDSSDSDAESSDVSIGDNVSSSSASGDNETEPRSRFDSPYSVHHHHEQLQRQAFSYAENGKGDYDSDFGQDYLRSPDQAEKGSQLPYYYPAKQGCRSVDEFQCLNRIEEGTYGVVYRAKEKATETIVALKRLKMEKEKEGFPITSLREICTLLKAHHQNIVRVNEIVVGSNVDKIYLVMEYVEHDLKGLMETMKQPFLVGEVKTLMIQLLRGVHHLHDNWILHRDLKTSNLLLSHKGILKIGDFGLAREYGSPLRPYTPIVVTLWYRCPELLLGTKEYKTPVDMWSVGCIFAELLSMKALFPGKSDIMQLNLIFKELGTPSEKIWPGYSELPIVKKTTFADYPYNTLRKRFGATEISETGFDLLNRFLTYSPERRASAYKALKHEWFSETPKPVEPSMFPTWPAKSEQAKKRVSNSDGGSPKAPAGANAYTKMLNEEEQLGFQLTAPKHGMSKHGMGFSLRF